MSDAGMEVEQFLQALAHQLDLAQDGLRLKALSGRPLTWAVKDLEIDLKVFIDLDRKGVMRWRTAGPNEEGASTVRLSFTTITREMVEENTFAYELDEDPRGIEELESELGTEARNRLERAGIRTIGQYKRVARTRPEAVRMQTGIPVLDLQAALRRSARPTVRGHEVVNRGGEELVRILGANLYDGVTPQVRLSGEPVEVLEAAPQALIIRPMAHHVDGPVEVEVGGERASGFYRVPSRVRAGDDRHGTPAPNDQDQAFGEPGKTDPWDAASGAWKGPGGDQ
jgi:hypothetical protein